MLTRRPHWPELLHAYFSQVRTRPFAWGEHDCALFVCGAIEAMTGMDLARDFRGRYHNRTGALRVMRTFCDGGIEQLAEKRAASFSVSEIPVANAQRGDIVLFDTELFGPTLGVVAMNGAHLFSVGPCGFSVIEVAGHCRRAWRI